MNFQFISGLANCHIPGLYSFVLSERKSLEVGMRRIFYAGVDCRMPLWNGADFRLRPHNHRQSITLTLMFGEVSNVLVKSKFGEHCLWCYEFDSALLNGNFTVKRMNREHDMRLVEQPLTRTPVHMHWSEVHTVTAAPGSAWMVEEHELAPENTARCWSTDGALRLSAEGLYVPLGAAELPRFQESIEKRIISRG